ncbi:MAG: hypothetical protein IMW89_21560 [Ktedonobacteraceae bacterium]|nr:hypothetical protein [Ktedonobacteraceae bacterium]
MQTVHEPVESHNQPQRQIFRQHALQHYMQNSEQQVLPRAISPRIFVACWLIFLLLLGTGLLIISTALF